MTTDREVLDLFFKSFPPGYRFCPTDDELIVFYLKKKILNLPLPPNKIEDVNIYKYNPQELHDRYQVEGENGMYFFSPRERKYPRGSRPKRTAADGYWKATGADRVIKLNNVVIGSRKSLVYYQGIHTDSTKTDWMMYEYKLAEQNKRHAKRTPYFKKSKRASSSSRVSPVDMKLDDCVLCKIYKKPIKAENEDESNPAECGNNIMTNFCPSTQSLDYFHSGIQATGECSTSNGSVSTAFFPAESVRCISSMPLPLNVERTTHQSNVVGHVSMINHEPLTDDDYSSLLTTFDELAPILGPADHLHLEYLDSKK